MFSLLELALFCRIGNNCSCKFHNILDIPYTFCNSSKFKNCSNSLQISVCVLISTHLIYYSLFLFLEHLRPHFEEVFKSIHRKVQSYIIDHRKLLYCLSRC